MTTRIEAGRLEGGVFRSEIHTFIRQKVFDKSVADEELIPWLDGIIKLEDYGVNGLVIRTRKAMNFDFESQRFAFEGRKAFLGDNKASVLIRGKESSATEIVYRVTYTKA